MMSSSLFLLPRTPTFRDAVAVVIQHGSEEQMRGIYAEADITVMADEQAVRDRPIRQFPCNAVGKQYLFEAGQLPISIRGSATSPYPTVTRFIYALPESTDPRFSLVEAMTPMRAESAPSLADRVCVRQEIDATVLAHSGDIWLRLGSHSTDSLRESVGDTPLGVSAPQGFILASIVPHFWRIHAESEA